MVMARRSGPVERVPGSVWTRVQGPWPPRRCGRDDDLVESARFRKAATPRAPSNDRNSFQKRTARMTGEPTAAADPASGTSTDVAGVAPPGRHAGTATDGAAATAPVGPNRAQALVRRVVIAVVAVVLLC